jgi:hypothetical protein
MWVPRQCKKPTEIHRTQTHKPTATYDNKQAHKLADSLVFVFITSRYTCMIASAVNSSHECYQSSNVRTYLRSTAEKNTLRLM